MDGLGHKGDAAFQLDAEAIAEAVSKQNMRFVQIKNQEQFDWQESANLIEQRGATLHQPVPFPVHGTYLQIAPSCWNSNPSF